MMNLPTVYVIVLNWNDKQDTLECLGSLRQLDYPNCEIVLVNNNSGDGIAAAVHKQFPDTRIIENDRNLGFAEGNNVGIRYALDHAADYVFLVNNDATVEPDTLIRLINVAERDPRIGMLCPTRVSFFDRAREYVEARIYWNWGAGVDVERSSQGLAQILETDYAPGCALLIKSQVIRQIGLLDPVYFAYFEDVDWSLRCREAGYRVVVVPAAKIYHKGSIDRSEDKAPLATFLFRRNQVLFMRRFGRWFDWPPFLKNYARQGLLRLEVAVEKNDFAMADAILDGSYAGLMGRFGTDMARSPKWFKHLVQGKLGLWLWVTSWLYWWDYEKAKRAKRNAVPEAS